VVGKVKTRLASSIGNDAAVKIHIEMLKNTVEMACDSYLAKVELHVSGNKNHSLFQALVRQYGITVHLQRGKDLGERMFYALQHSLDNGGYCLLIGTDCPVMTTDYLASALDILEQRQDVVLGPSEDGGYVLIGARQVQISWFSDIPWGGHHVLELSRQKIIASGTSYRELQPLWDIDRIQDLRRWRLQNETG
jgi:rSAM/selenodomain-associated transferase 1